MDALGHFRKGKTPANQASAFKNRNRGGDRQPLGGS